MPLDQNPHQTVTHFGCVSFSIYVCGFSVPKILQFCLFTYPPRSKCASSVKMTFFFAKSGIFCKPIAGPLSKAITHWMVNGLQLLNQFYSVWRHTKVRFNDVSKMINCWERRWIDVDSASRTLSRVYALLASHSWVYRWGCQFRSHTELTVLLFF